MLETVLFQHRRYSHKLHTAKWMPCYVTCEVAIALAEARTAFFQREILLAHCPTGEEDWINLGRHPYKTSSKYLEFWHPSHACPHLELIFITKFTQPPLLHPPFYTPPLLWCGHHIWTLHYHLDFWIPTSAGVEGPVTVHCQCGVDMDAPASFLCVTLLTPNSRGTTSNRHHPVQQRQVGQTEGNGGGQRQQNAIGNRNTFDSYESDCCSFLLFRPSNSTLRCPWGSLQIWCPHRRGKGSHGKADVVRKVVLIL